MARNPKNRLPSVAGLALAMVLTTGCAGLGPKVQMPALDLEALPGAYPQALEAAGASQQAPALTAFFQDETLQALIKTALENNQERNIVLQELRMAENEAKARGGEVWPFLSVGGGWDREKVGRYTRAGAVEEGLELAHEKNFPDPLSNFRLGAQVSWEIDIWRKLRNERDGAVLRYLSTVEGQRFLVTHLVAEVAETYYALLALDSRLTILDNTIALQQEALELVRLQKDAAATTQLAVTKFEAEVLGNQSERLVLQQERVREENRLHFLLGRYPEELARPAQDFTRLSPPPSPRACPRIFCACALMFALRNWP